MYILMGGETVEGTIGYAVSASDATRFGRKQSNGRIVTVTPNDAARMASHGTDILMFIKIRGMRVGALISCNMIIVIPYDGRRATCDALFGHEATGWASAHGSGGCGGHVGQIGSSHSSGSATSMRHSRSRQRTRTIPFPSTDPGKRKRGAR